MKVSRSFTIEQRNIDFLETKSKELNISKSRIMDNLLTSLRENKAKVRIVEIMKQHELRLRNHTEKLLMLEKRQNLVEKELKL